MNVDTKEIIDVLDSLADFVQGRIVELRAENDAMIERLLNEEYSSGSLAYPRERRDTFNRTIAPTEELVRRANEISDRLEGKTKGVEPEEKQAEIHDYFPFPDDIETED
jgi:hypothetical protein